MSKAMIITLQLEEAAMTVLSVYFLYLHNLGLPFWLWVPLFLSPDIGMLGYLVSTKVGAFSYNLFHHKGLAIGLALAGYFFRIEILMVIGMLMFAHSSFDRMMGYGLKYIDDFKHTHLGWLLVKEPKPTNLQDV
jgi:hypothetical protein